MTTDFKTTQRDARRRRVRAKISGTASRPRLAVHRSNTQMRAQLINDELGNTIAAVTTAKQSAKTKREQIEAAAKQIAELANKAGVTEVVFDRGGFSYEGNIKLFADTAREAGLKF